MKRLSTRHKLYLERRRPKLFARRVASRIKRRLRNSKAPSLSVPLRFRRVGKVRIATLSVPPVLSFSRNYRDTIEFFRMFRDLTVRRRRRILVDFTRIRELGPSAALMLAAEFDRWRTLFRFRPTVVDIQEWDPVIRQRLFDMGLFDLLRVKNSPAKSIVFEAPTEVRFVKFRSGVQVVGQRAVELRRALEELCGKVPDQKLLFKALSEAMTNVIKHAYPDYSENRDKYVGRPPPIKRWWMTASFDVQRQTLRVLFFDQGVGIPATIERKYPLERIRGLFASIGVLDDDAQRIKAAMVLGRSRSSRPNRGKGLPNLREIVDSRANQGHPARLRILSGRGEYIYEGTGRETCLAHPQHIGGTLIQWDFSL